MNHLLLIILSLFLTLKEIHCQNTTETATSPQPTTTEMYTTLEDLIATNDPDEALCEFEYEAILHDAEHIVITICGYQDDTGSAAVDMVAITLQLPQDRWVGVGFVTNDNYVEESEMTDVYAIIVPQSRDIQERALVENGDCGDALQPQLELYEDMRTNGQRKVKMSRKVTIENSDLDSGNIGTVLNYFDFSKFNTCNSGIKILHAFSTTAQQQFTSSGGHGSNRGVVDADVDEEYGISCGNVAINEANKGCVITAIIISIIAVAFH